MFSHAARGPGCAAENSGRMATEKGRATKASETPTLKVGDAAPDFTLTSHRNEKFTLSDKRGTNVVIAFYPFAFTGT